MMKSRKNNVEKDKLMEDGIKMGIDEIIKRIKGSLII